MKMISFETLVNEACRCTSWDELLDLNDFKEILERWGDEYYYSRDTGQFELSKKSKK